MILTIFLFTTVVNSGFLRTSQKLVIPNSEPFQPVSTFFFRFSAEIEPKPEKKAKGGEDALVASKYLLAVADGVGGWSNLGIDPSDYSFNLVNNAWLYFETISSTYAKNPKKLIQESEATNTFKGSSTFVVCSLFEDKLNTAYVGDSGMMVLVPQLKNLPKNGGTTYIYDIVQKTQPQQHAFNFPFQLGTKGDDPQEVTIESSLPIVYGAIVLVYSDGVSDNIFAYELKQLVNYYINDLKKSAGIQIRDFVPKIDASQIALKIKNLAFKKSLQEDLVSPFGAQALDHGVIFKGGKSDDISIIAAVIDLPPKDDIKEQP